ncbi:ATP-binding protein [Streptomyces sp. NPDC057552]|uniref:ATP-binding protein n=1 Tax=Streptomyces sp. NPDC057552 TaxID=3350537 RepID=UPI0036B46298
MWVYGVLALALLAAAVGGLSARRARASARAARADTELLRQQAELQQHQAALQKQHDDKLAENLRAEVERHRAEAARADEYSQAAVREFVYLAETRLPAMVGALRHPGRQMPGPADVSLMSTPVGAACDQVLRKAAAALEDERVRTDEAAQAVLRTVMGSFRAQAAQAEVLAERVQRQMDGSDLLKSMYELDENLVLMRRLAQRTAVACGDAPGTARENTPVAIAVATAQSRVREHRRVSVVNHVPREADGQILALQAPVAEPLIMVFAELLENAVYSSVGSTQVRAELHRTATGVLVMISDSGPGLDTVEKQRFVQLMLASDRRLLLSDLGSPPRLGLATVGRLAARFDGLSITMDPSSARGVCVNVHIDNSLLVAVSEPARPAASGAKLQPIASPKPVPAPRPEPAGPAEEERPRPALPARSSADGFPTRRRKSPDTAPSAVPDAPPSAPERDPAAVRSAYASMQSGAQRARSEQRGPETAGPAPTSTTSWETR